MRGWNVVLVSEIWLGWGRRWAGRMRISLWQAGHTDDGRVVISHLFPSLVSTFILISSNCRKYGVADHVGYKSVSVLPPTLISAIPTSPSLHFFFNYFNVFYSIQLSFYRQVLSLCLSLSHTPSLFISLSLSLAPSLPPSIPLPLSARGTVADLTSQLSSSYDARASTARLLEEIGHRWEGCGTCVRLDKETQLC